MPMPTGTRPAARQNSRIGCLVISVTTVPDRVNTSDMAAITVSIALFATSAPASTEVGFMVASPFFKNLYVIACCWGLALQLVVMGDSGNCAGFILVVDDKGTIVWRLLIVSG